MLTCHFLLLLLLKFDPYIAWRVSSNNSDYRFVTIYILYPLLLFVISCYDVGLLLFVSAVFKV